MSHESILFEIKRNEGSLSAIKVVMPTWQYMEDGLIYAKLPFLGIETYGNSEEDLEIAIREAVIGFCVVAEKYGKGLEAELASLGWDKVEEYGDTAVFDATAALGNNEVLESIIETGDTRFLNVELESYLQAA